MATTSFHPRALVLGSHRRNLALAFCSFYIISSLYSPSTGAQAFITEERRHPSNNSHRPRQRQLQQEMDASGTFKIEWAVDLGGNEERILESLFLKAGLEQRFKDYMNADLHCNGVNNQASFYSFELINVDENRKISAQGICVGDREWCQWDMMETTASNKNDKLKSNKLTSSTKESTNKMDNCDQFGISTVFDFFPDISIPGNSFASNAQVEVIMSNDDYDLDLDYNVTFVPVVQTQSQSQIATSIYGWDQITSVQFDVVKVTEISDMAMACDSLECQTQRSRLFDIFRQLGKWVAQDVHECQYPGVNCNSDGLVTQVFLGEFVYVLE